MRKRLRNVWAVAENRVPVACLLVGARYEFKRCLSFHESKEVRRGKGDMVSSTILGSKVFEVFWSHDRKILCNPWLRMEPCSMIGRPVFQRRVPLLRESLGLERG
jgi:hypothetical protein